MLHSFLLTVHIGCGILGILSGTAALSFRKGSTRHALAGKVFVASMLTVAAAAVYLAILKHQTPNILAGVLAFYLINQGWLATRRGDGQTSRVDWGVLLIPLAGGSLGGVIGLGKLIVRPPAEECVPTWMGVFAASVELLEC